MSSSSASSANHLLLVFIKEPVEGQVKKQLSQAIGVREAALNYKTLCQTLLSQLIGLTDTHIRFCISPPDAIDAVKFWLLPLLDGTITPVTEQSYKLTPSSHAPELFIEFSADEINSREQAILHQQTKGFDQGFVTVTTIGTNCPECGARWINTGRLLCKQPDDVIVGTCQQNTPYLTIVRKPHYVRKNSPSLLPTLDKIKTEQDWANLLNSPIAGKINTHYKAITGKEAF